MSLIPKGVSIPVSGIPDTAPAPGMYQLWLIPELNPCTNFQPVHLRPDSRMVTLVGFHYLAMPPPPEHKATWARLPLSSTP